MAFRIVAIGSQSSLLLLFAYNNFKTQVFKCYIGFGLLNVCVNLLKSTCVFEQNLWTI